MSRNRRKRQFTKRLKRLLFINVFLVSILFLGLGYSLLSTNLNIFGNVEIKEYMEPTLYNVLKKEAEIGTYAKEYTGNHNDSMDTSLSTEKIYHWNAPNITVGNTIATEILNKNNVIFANHCWQMIRTTDTGGVKLLYNGEPENNKCLDSRGNHVGYSTRTSQSLDTTYYYGTSYTYDKTNNVFSLAGTISTGEIKIGEYTCKSTESSGTCSALYLIDGLNTGTTYYVYQINGNSHYSEYGKVPYNHSYDLPSSVGYMYNNNYSSKTKRSTSENILYQPSIDINYYYGDGIEYVSPYYRLINPFKINSLEESDRLVGKYTLRSTSINGSNIATYITAVNGSVMYVIDFYGGDLLNDYNYQFTYGDSFTDNGNGTYTINNPTTIQLINYANNYSNMKNKYICKNAVNNTCNEMWYSIDTTSYSINYIKTSDYYKYAQGFTYSNGTYILNNDAVSFWDITNDDNITSINDHHYTCWNSSGECTTLAYIFRIKNNIEIRYIDLTDGKGINDALNDMLFNDNVNQINSPMKSLVDFWYKKHLIDYSSQLEDTVFCADRNISKLNGWNPNGGRIDDDLEFLDDYYYDLFCSNETDKFSLNNLKAQLIYPVGLMTYSEAQLLGRNNIIYSGQNYWLLTPSGLANDIARISYVSSGTGISGNGVVAVLGLRPVVSLKPGTEYTSGDGSMANPYVVE